MPNFIKIGRPTSWICEIQIFYLSERIRGPYCIAYQVLYRSIKPLWRYHDFCVLYKIAAADILDFQKFKILTIDPLPGANMRHHTKFHQNRKIGQTVTEIWLFNSFFQNGGRLPSWICWTTGDDVLVVCIVVPNLVKIDAVVSIT